MSIHTPEGAHSAASRPTAPRELQVKLSDPGFFRRHQKMSSLPWIGLYIEEEPEEADEFARILQMVFGDPIDQVRE